MKKTSFQNDLWTSLQDIPIYNWNEVSGGDYTKLYKSNNPKKKYSDHELLTVWFSLQDQHFDEFGTEESLRFKVKIMQKLYKLNKKFIETRDRVLLNFIKIETENLNSTVTKHFTFYEVLSALTTFKKFDIDPKTYLAIKWFHDLKSMSNGKS